MSGGDLLVSALATEGVKYIFSLSGAETHSIFDACLDRGIEIMDSRHEQAAVHMADGWARATGQPGVAVLAAGPGVTNGITAVAAALQAHSPILVIGGRSPLAQAERGAARELDQIALMRPITKWAQTIYDTSRIPDMVATAFRHALTGRPGPVFLDIPRDVLEAEVSPPPPTPQGYRPHGSVHGDPASVRAAVELIAKARRPVILAGTGLRISGAGHQLLHLAEELGVPVVLAKGGARGCLPEDHPLCFLRRQLPTQEADLVLVLGTRLDAALSFGGPPTFGKKAKVIQVDIEPREIGRNRPVEVGIAGDLKAVLGQMLQELKGLPKAKRGSWLETCHASRRAWQQRLEPDLNSAHVPIHPLRLCRELRDFLSPDATIAPDGGDTSVFGSSVLRAFHPGHWLDNGLWTLGTGIPFAMAAKLARPAQQSVVLTGDGSFGFNAMEFHTMVRRKLPVVVVINNDGAWGMIKHIQTGRYGAARVVATELGFTRYDKMVEALGGHGEYVEQPQDIRPALERAFASGLPACVNVKVDDTISSSYL